MSALSVEALQGARGPAFDFTVAPGTCLWVRGPSGAGKTTLLRLLADLEPATGTVRLGPDLRDAMPAPRWRARVTWVPAEPRFWEETALAHLKPPARARFLELARQLGLRADDLQRAVQTLSSGEQQRVALARAMVNGAEVLLLDEPTSALDDEATARVEAVLRDWLAAGHSLVLVSHRELRLPHATLHLAGRAP